MTKQGYIKQIAKGLKCSSSRRKEIEKQLNSHIELALEEGRELQDILAEMGEPEAIAREFNESFAEEGQPGKRRWRRVAIILAAVLAVLGIGGAAVWWALPKGSEIAESDIFREAEVRSSVQEVITLFSQEDYQALDAWLTPEVRAAVEKEPFDKIRQYIGGEWGELSFIGNMYMVEITQMGRHYAVVEANASYEAVSVTFTLSFTEDLKLYGFYVK